MVEDPCQLADQLALEVMPTGLTHGDFMPNNALVTDSGAAILDFGSAERDCLGVDVARYCLGLCLERTITDATLLCGSFLEGYAAVQPFGDVLCGYLPELVYLASYRIAL